MQRLKPGDKEYKYSFSTLSAVYECPYMVYLQKIEESRKEEAKNIFAEIGTLIHNLLDEWSKGEIDKDDLSMVYAERFEEEVVTPAPANLEKHDYRNKQKQLGIDFFDNFDGFKGFTVLGAEERFETELDGKKFVGCVDMILQDNNTGALIMCDHEDETDMCKYVPVLLSGTELIICDHKSKNKDNIKNDYLYKDENGKYHTLDLAIKNHHIDFGNDNRATINKTIKESIAHNNTAYGYEWIQEVDMMYRQQYLYSKYIYEQFGRYPDFLMFHLFKNNGEKIARRFNKREYDETIEWAKNLIKEIEEKKDAEDWKCYKEQTEDDQPDFFCTTICSMRNICHNGKKKYKPKGKK